MVLDGDFYKEGGDPNSIHAVSLYIYKSGCLFWVSLEVS